MKSIPDRKLILDVGKDTGIDPAFIEKDWYIVQMLEALAGMDGGEDIRFAFCGGTSLSKAFGITKRFSEDLDFFLCSDKPPDRDVRRSFRDAIVGHIQADSRFSMQQDKLPPEGHDRFFGLEVNYGMEFKEYSLRPHLLLDMTYGSNRLPLETQAVKSILADFTGDPPEVRIDCISPIETASDKISALAWRVIDRGDDPGKGDPRMVRHIHDLAALKETILEAPKTFVSCARESMERDRQRERGGESIAAMDIPERLEKVSELLATREFWRNEYNRFVKEMSFAPEEERIVFDEALPVVHGIAGLLIESVKMNR